MQLLVIVSALNGVSVVFLSNLDRCLADHYSSCLCFSLVSLSWYLQSELHVKVSGPQKLQQEAVGEGPNAGQAAGQHRPAPQAAHKRSQVLRVVGKFIELRPVHVAPRPGYILMPSRGAEGAGRSR